MSETEKLSGLARANPIGVDRENARINGLVLAEKGPFKTPFRGEFDGKSLTAIVSLIKQKGSVRSRFGHATPLDNGPGNFLGRVSNPRLDGDRVRGDLQFNPSAFKAPRGDLASYVMELAQSDPQEGLSTSLVLTTEQELRLNKNGTLKEDANGDPLPPLWRPLEVFQSDIVDVGDAVHNGMLAALPKGLRETYAEDMMESVFRLMAGLTDRKSLESWIESVVERHFGHKSPRSTALIERCMTQGRELEKCHTM